MAVAEIAVDMLHLEGTDLWLTPTAEVELSSLYRDETVDADQVTVKGLRLDGVLFEAGAAGKDTRGILRQHQFQKVEMFQLTRPEQSYTASDAGRRCRILVQKLDCTIAPCCSAPGTWASASSKT